MGFLWVILIGFVAGIITRLISPGQNKPSGFIPHDRTGHRGGIPRHVHRSSNRLVSP
jgi:uncharacterized membrane protein YeaQ/YmgE (transglycosylase-associated protein family)